mmetsp:Transcript_28209/g.66163  ORF Transcript_28209/g.66163 Transcript_28209/m.66163 type:complete len:201 (+) Transcript_28209:1421-2023(+)
MTPVFDMIGGERGGEAVRKCLLGKSRRGRCCLVALVHLLESDEEELPHHLQHQIRRVGVEHHEHHVTIFVGVVESRIGRLDGLDLLLEQVHGRLSNHHQMKVVIHLLLGQLVVDLVQLVRRQVREAFHLVLVEDLVLPARNEAEGRVVELDDGVLILLGLDGGVQLLHQTLKGGVLGLVRRKSTVVVVGGGLALGSGATR